MSGKQPAAESVQRLNMERAGEDQLWVMKVPRFLAEHLSDAASAGRSLGVVQEQPRPAGGAGPSRDGRGGRNFKLTLSDAAAPADEIPREYDMTFTEPPAAMYVLSLPSLDGKKAGEPQHEGRIAAKGEVRPGELSAEYKAVLRKRGEAHAVEEKIGVLTEDQARELKRARLDHMGHANAAAAGKASKLAKRDAASVKRAKAAPMSRLELREAVKAAFETKAYWARRDLESVVGNAKELSACLEELCVKVTKKGVRYGDYRLKPEFTTGLAAAAGPP